MRDQLKSNFRIALIGIICTILLGYSFFEARFLINGPKLTIFSPQDNQTVNDPLLEIRGQVENISGLAINGRQIMITPDGMFAGKLLLLDGYNTIEVKASNKFGQENSKILKIVLRPAP